MDYIFYQVAAVNGFDSVGHYLRAGLMVNQCATYAIEPVAGCSANFPQASGSTSSLKANTSAVDSVGDDPVLKATAIALARALGQAGRGDQEQEGPHEQEEVQEGQAPQPGPPWRDADADAARRPPRRPRPRRRRPPLRPPRRRPRRRSSSTPERDAHADADRRPVRRAARLPLRRRRMRSRGSGIAGNPVLIGAATVLVVLVAVFLSYNANQRPAVRADLPGRCGDAERRPARRRQRRQDRRLARRRGHRDQAEDAATTAA